MDHAAPTLEESGEVIGQKSIVPQTRPCSFWTVVSMSESRSAAARTVVGGGHRAEELSPRRMRKSPDVVSASEREFPPSPPARPQRASAQRILGVSASLRCGGKRLPATLVVPASPRLASEPGRRIAFLGPCGRCKREHP